MKRFKYRLQTKLDITLKQEDMARQELARCEREYRRQLAQLEMLDRELGAIFQKLREKNRQVVNISQVVLFKDYVPVLRHRISAQQENVSRSEHQVGKARSQLVKIRRERKALERLREKEWQDYQREFYRQEQLELDEVALAGYWRASLNPGG